MARSVAAMNARMVATTKPPHTAARPTFPRFGRDTVSATVTGSTMPKLEGKSEIRNISSRSWAVNKLITARRYPDTRLVSSLYLVVGQIRADHVQLGLALQIIYYYERVLFTSARQ